MGPSELHVWWLGAHSWYRQRLWFIALACEFTLCLVSVMLEPAIERLRKWVETG